MFTETKTIINDRVHRFLLPLLSDFIIRIVYLTVDVSIS